MMTMIYLFICLVGVVLLVILAVMGGFGAMADVGDFDVDVDAGGGDVDLDFDAGDADIDFDVDAGGGDIDVDTDVDVDIDAGGGDIEVDVAADVEVDVDAAVESATDFQLSPFSPPVLSIFATVFGGMGLVFDALLQEWYYVLIITIIVSIGLSTVIYIGMVKIFQNVQATSLISLTKLVGMRAKCTIRIRPGAEGQVLVVREERGRMLLPAISDEEIEVDADVQIIESLGNIIKVAKPKKKRKPSKDKVRKIS